MTGTNPVVKDFAQLRKLNGEGVVFQVENIGSDATQYKEFAKDDAELRTSALLETIREKNGMQT